MTILHSGLHEAEFRGDVEHLHVDPHAEAALHGALAGRTFDVGIAMYGRLQVVADALVGHVGQAIAVGGVFYEGWINDQFHADGHGGIAEVPMPPYTIPPVPMPESAPMDANPNNRFARRALAAERRVMELHAARAVFGDDAALPEGVRATGGRPARVERRAACARWRVAMLVPDGGLAQETEAVRADRVGGRAGGLDHPDEAAGETFNVGDARPTTTREWITLLADALGAELDLVSIPFVSAAPTFPYARDPWTICHRVLDVSKLATLLRWEPALPVEAALAVTARHLAEHPLGRSGEDEDQVGDPFDYELEDAYLREAAAYRQRLAALGRPASGTATRTGTRRRSASREAGTATAGPRLGRT